MDDIISKLKSDRLWALGAYAGFMILNIKAELGVPAEQMTELMWAVLAFIGSKGLRGTVGGNMLEQAVPMVTKLVSEGKPGVPIEELHAEPTDESRAIARSRLETPLPADLRDESP